jgi:hypothetical protein
MSSQLHTGGLNPPPPPSTHWIGGFLGPRAGLDDMEKLKFLTLSGLEFRPLGYKASSRQFYQLRLRSILQWTLLTICSQDCTTCKSETDCTCYTWAVSFQLPSARRSFLARDNRCVTDKCKWHETAREMDCAARCGFLNPDWWALHRCTSLVKYY